MGGTALKQKFGFEGRRISAEEYNRIVDELLERFHNHVIYDLHVYNVRSYRGKPDHGDIDLVANPSTDNFPVDWSDAITQAASPRFLSKNSNVYSFDYKDVQIDLAAYPTGISCEMHCSFCDWAPFGNIFSRLLKQFNLKWGIQGLVYPVKLSDSEQLGEVFLSNNLTDILKFSEMDPDTYHRGFDVAEEIYEYVYSSPYFNADIYRLENLNHINRTRDRKRKDYHAWLEWCLEKPNKWTAPTNKSVWIDKINKHFKCNLYEEINKRVAIHTWKKSIAEKFNGNLITEYIGLEGESLGKFIHGFKKYITDSNDVNSPFSREKWNYFIANKSQQEIELSIRYYYNHVFI